MSKNAKMVFCKQCNNVIAASAKQCPYCGARNKKPFYKRWWLVVILVIVVFCIINSVSGSIKKGSEEDTEYEADQETYSKPIVDEEKETEEKKTEETTQIESEVINTAEETQVSEENNDLINGVDPDLKAFLDEYEEFMNQYTDFMVKYESSDNTISMLADYTKILQEYAEFTDKLAKYDTKEMSAADAAYYLEVTSRVSENMLKKMG
jgi:RNA polymerase subunit RPABC4/transcription elongation factor Spt4